MTLEEYIKTTPNMSQNKFAKLIPCDRTHITHIIAGKRVPSYMMAKRIEQVTDGKVEKDNWYE